MTTNYHQISIFIPQTFFNAFYQHLGRKRDYPLTRFLSATFPKSRILPFLPVLTLVLRTTLNSCFLVYSLKDNKIT